MSLVRAGRRVGHLLWVAARHAPRARLAEAHAADRLQRAFRALARSHGVTVDVNGAWPGAPAVLVANHVSYLDPLVIGACRPLAPVAKAEVGPWPLLGAAARRLGTILVDRSCAFSGARALRRGARVLSRGVDVLVFPEGTTTSGRTLLPFELGAFGLAVLGGVPVVPVAIRYEQREVAWTGGATFLPHYLRLAARRELRAHLYIGAPLRAATTRSASERRRAACALAEQARVALLGLLGATSGAPSPENAHASAISHRVPAPRPDAVLSPADVGGRASI